MAETVLNQQESNQQESNQQESKIVGPGTQGRSIRTKRILGIILSLVMIALTAFVFKLQNQNYKVLSQSTDMSLISNQRAANNYVTYVGKYKETKIELDETTRKLEAVNRQLDQVTAELTTTKGMLSDTQGMLVAAQDENTKLKQELQGLNDLGGSATKNAENMAELQTTIKALQDRDAQVSQQLADLKGQMRAFDIDVSSLPEGKSLIVLFQNKIRLVKSRMHYLQQQAFYTKVEAQHEKDRLAVLNGNSGFVIRNGQELKPASTGKSFAIDVKIVQ